MKCIQCKEWILDDCAVCRHCGADQTRKTPRVDTGALKAFAVVGLIFIAAVLYFRSDSTPSQQTVAQSSASTVKRETEAQKLTHKIKINLDDPMEKLMMQMPDDPLPNVERTGKYRIYTWTFKDGSKLRATFVPTAEAGGGLILNSVEMPN